jgi:LEA14-like dessication related protein
MRRYAARSAIGLICLTIACATFARGAFKAPIVTLRDARITGVGTSGGSVEVELDVYNPNGFKLDGVRMTYNVLIDSVTFGRGNYDSRFTVESRDSTRLKLPFTFTYAGIGAAGRQLIQTGTVEYHVTGDVTVGTPLGQFTRPYDQRGRFSTLSGVRR